MEDILLLVLIALVTVLIVRNYKLEKEIKNKHNELEHYEKLASFDSLTLVYNRYMLDTILEQQLAIVSRYRKMLSIIFFDIDDFKIINDKYGHDAGDAVLIEISQIISTSIRGSDIFGRWGGDEFLLILPETSKKQASKLAEILDRKIREHTFPYIDHVSCSFGVASYEFGDKEQDILKRVDESLYEAKKNKHKRF